MEEKAPDLTSFIHRLAITSLIMLRVLIFLVLLLLLSVSLKSYLFCIPVFICSTV